MQRLNDKTCPSASENLPFCLMKLVLFFSKRASMRIWVLNIHEPIVVNILYNTDMFWFAESVGWGERTPAWWCWWWLFWRYIKLSVEMKWSDVMRFISSCISSYCFHESAFLPCKFSSYSPHDLQHLSNMMLLPSVFYKPSIAHESDWLIVLRSWWHL